MLRNYPNSSDFNQRLFDAVCFFFFKYESLTPEKSKKNLGKEERRSLLDMECACFNFLVKIWYPAYTQPASVKFTMTFITLVPFAVYQM